MNAEDLLDQWLPGGLNQSFVICTSTSAWEDASKNLKSHFPSLEHFKGFNLRNMNFKIADDFEKLPYPVGVGVQLAILKNYCPRRHENLVTSGALGCSMSHLKIWDECKDLSGWTLIFESDARTQPKFREKLQTIVRNDAPGSNVNTIRLSYSDKLNTKNKLVPGGCFNEHVSGNAFGNEAYLVRNSALKFFLKMHVPVQFQIDCLMFMMAELGIGGASWKIVPSLRLFKPYKHPSSTNYGAHALIQLFPDSRAACNGAILAPYILAVILLIALLCAIFIPRH